MYKTINLQTATTIVLLALVIVIGTLSCQREGGQPQGHVADRVQADVNWPDSAFKAYRRLTVFFNNDQVDSLAAQTPEVTALCSEHGQWHWYYASWSLLAEKYIFQADSKKGFAEANRIREDAEQRNNNYGRALACYLMGAGYANQGAFDEALRNCQQAAEIYPRNEDIASLVNIYNLWVQVLHQKEDYRTMADVMKLYKELIDGCPVVEGSADVVKHASWHFHYQKQAFEYFNKVKDYDKASEALDSAEYYTQFSEGLKWQQFYLTGCRTKLAITRKNYGMALFYNDREMEMAKKMGYNQQVNALQNRWEVLKENRRYEEALEAYGEYHKLTDSLNQADSRAQLNEMNKRFELDELRAQQEREKMDHERQQFRLTMLIAVLIVAALSLFIYFRYRSAKRLKEEHQKLVDAYAQLETSNNQLSTLNTELTQANARAEESSMMKTNFIQQISHEIRTPLNILSGFTQIITTPGMELDEETRADINRQITENTGRITGLVNKMLELSDANSQAVIERNDDVSAIQLAAEAAEASRIGETAGMSFDFDIAPDTETVMLHTNHQQAVRALTLLLDNARKFLVRPGEELHGSVKLALRQGDGGMFSFIIEDTGIGIPAEEAEHIFDEFVQLDDYYDGTGIGLTVARSIVRRLGGDIVLDTSYQGMATAEASTSKGSRFVVTLPL